MSDDESESNSKSGSENSGSGSNSDESGSEESEELRKFPKKQLKFQSEINVEIKPREDSSTISLMQKIKYINCNLDKIGTNLQSAVDKYNRNTKSISSSQIFKDNNGGVNYSEQDKPVPQRFDNFNNPYKKITSYNNSAKYSNNIGDLYKNQYNDFSKSNNQGNIYNNYDKNSKNSSNNNYNNNYNNGNFKQNHNNFNTNSSMQMNKKSNNNLNHNNHYNFNSSNEGTTKIYYRRTNES